MPFSLSPGCVGFTVTTVEVLDERGEAALGKPKGAYVTVELDALIRREENAFPEACGLLSEVLRGLLPQEGRGDGEHHPAVLRI